MLRLSILNNRIQLTLALSVPSDVFLNAILTSNDGASRATIIGGDEYANGMLLTDSGRIRYVDATLGLPANTVWSNGLPRSNGALCVALSNFSFYSNGIPFAANGAVSAVVTP